MKYRIVPNSFGGYSVEQRCFFFFWMRLIGSYPTIIQAKTMINHLEQKM